MPFLAPVITGIGGILTGISTFLGSGTILAGIVKVGLGLAAQYALGQILGPKPQAQAMQLETAYGENLARSVILGRVGTAGHHIYRNAFGNGGRRVQDVYVLSHFRATRITRVRYKGKWTTLGPESSEHGLRVQGTGEAYIWVKFYAGTMTQAADPQLIALSNPPGRWTVSHRLAGVSYAVVTYALDREVLPQPPEFFVEVEGAPLYDWRKDSTVGGTGSHRWDNQSTWEFSTNPVLMEYALERGLFNGTEKMVGKGVAASRLPIAEWAVAANICDEIVAGKRRYQAGLMAMSGQGSTHAANMQPLLDASAASWVETAAGEYPIVGANQAVVATFTDDDIMVDEPYRFSHKRTRTELVNTAAGSFSNPENFYEASPLATRIDDIALDADGERLAVSIPYGAVTHVEVGDRLLDIAIRASRYQANAEICLRPKFIQIQPGRWVRFNSTKHGDRKFLVLQKRLGAIGTNSARNVYLTLQEVGDGVFDPTAYVTLPPDVIVPGAPDYLAEVDNFRVTPNIIQDEKGSKRPGARVSWNPIEDVTVTHVQLRYRPVAQPTVILYDTDTVDVIVRQIANGLTSNSNWEISSRLLTKPARKVAWSEWVQFTTLDARLGSDDVYLSIDVNQLNQDMKANLLWMRDSIREAQDEMERIGQLVSNTQSASDQRFTKLRVQQGKAYASFDETITVIANANLALTNKTTILESAINDPATGLSANSIAVQTLSTEVQAGFLSTSTALNDLRSDYNNVSAGATFKMQTMASPGGGWSRIGLQTRVDANSSFLSAALFLDANSLTGLSRVTIAADQFVITDAGGTTKKPFVFVGGEAYMEEARIGTVTFNQLSSTNGKLILKGFGTNASIEILT